MSENSKEQRMSGVVAITNGNPSVLNLTIEPWADQHELSVGDTLELVFDGPVGGRLEVEVKPNGLTIYGWPGSTVSARR